jgi:hypothetical protein
MNRVSEMETGAWGPPCFDAGRKTQYLFPKDEIIKIR